MKIRISARRSDLARLQAYQVGNALKRAHRGLEIDYLFKESLGDKNQADPLWKMPERGVFTEDFANDLLRGETDLVVHSWKDMPTETRPGLCVAATMKRADPRDLLLLRKDAMGEANLNLLTSSPRRTFNAAAELKGLLPFPTNSVITTPVRGNVATRLKKLRAGDGHGLFLAKAALDRLLSSQEDEFAAAREEIRGLLAHFHWMALPLSLFPTAAAQGALAVEILGSRADLLEKLAPLQHAETFECVGLERRQLAAFGGGCHQKIGVTCVPHPRFGWVEFFHGEPEGQSANRRMRFFSAPPPPLAHSTVWPESTRPIFGRKEIAGVPNTGGDLFIARADALPHAWKIDANSQCVWAAGTRTWKKLAARGVWVHGCADGLGESLPEVENMLGRRASWTKLTHAGSANDALFPCLATYRLEALQVSSVPLVDAYFWPSESLFQWALAKRPEIRERQHAAGPGFTAEAIEKELGRPIDVYYNYSHWRTGDAYEES